MWKQKRSSHQDDDDDSTSIDVEQFFLSFFFKNKPRPVLYCNGGDQVPQTPEHD
jgi:hypothetical protein